MAAKAASSIKAAIKEWEATNGDARNATILKLCAENPPLQRLDTKFLNSTLTKCIQLSLSTNTIERMGGLKLPKLRILSLGRNKIKKIDCAELANSLEELWLSYNEISSLDGAVPLLKLKKLYLANNHIKSWSELEKLKTLPALDDLVLFGNPIYEDYDDIRATRAQIIARVPQITKLDNKIVTPLEREIAASEGEEAGSPRRGKKKK